MTYGYGQLQISVWWLCHVAVLFWRIRFPLHARSFILTKKMKYIHVFCIFAGLVLPLLQMITVIADSAVQYKSNGFLKAMKISFTSSGMGFQKAFTNSQCLGTIPAALYSLVIPLCVIAAIAMTLVILICFYVHRVSDNT